MSQVLSKAKASLVASLSQKKMRRRHGLFVAEGKKCVEDTLGVFTLSFAVGVEDTNLDQLNIESDKFYVASRDTMQKISSLSTAPDLLAVYMLPERGIVPPLNDDTLALALDGIQDPGNLGTIIRAAHWFGIRRIYCSEDTADLFNPKTIMATMGSLGHVEIYYCDLTDLISNRPQGLPVYATLLDGKNIYSQSLSSNGLIVMGNEGKGISKELCELVTDSLTIPPGNREDHAESLNVGVAAAVVLSQFRAREFRSL